MKDITVIANQGIKGLGCRKRQYNSTSDKIGKRYMFVKEERAIQTKNPYCKSIKPDKGSHKEANEKDRLEQNGSKTRESQDLVIIKGTIVWTG